MPKETFWVFYRFLKHVGNKILNTVIENLDLPLRASALLKMVALYQPAKTSLYQTEMQLRKYITNNCFALALGEMQQYLYSAGKLFFSTLLTARGKVLLVVKDALSKFLPANAHQLASGKLHIILTRLRDWNCVVVSEFTSKEDIIQVRAFQVWVASQQPQMSQHSQGQEIFATLPSRSLAVFPIGRVMQLLHPSVFWLYPSSVPRGGEYSWVRRACRGSG